MCSDRPTSHPPIRVSAVTYSAPVGKKLSLAPDEETVIKEPLLEMRATTGRLRNHEFATVEEAFKCRLDAEPSTMFFTGTFDPEIKHADVVPEARRLINAQPDMEPMISVTGEFLSFRDGPGLISIDIDVKSREEVSAIYPDEEMPVFKTADVVLDALYDVLPEARDCPVLVMPSSSSKIERVSNGALVKGPGGWRVVLATSDASQTPRILQAIHIRCWARGFHRFAFISKGGQFLPRSLADQALARPTQPDYPTAVLGEGLQKTPGAHIIRHVDVELFDPASVEVSLEDQHAATANLNEARVALKPEQSKANTRRKAEYEKDLIDRGVPKPAAERAATVKVEKGLLLGSDYVVFDSGELASVSTLLSPEGEKYDLRVCLDPIEPDYDGGRAVGKFYWNNGDAPGVHSFAHGNRFYTMRHDVESATAAIAAAAGDNSTIVHALALSELSELENKTVERDVAIALGLGNSRRELRTEVTRERDRIYQSVGHDEGHDEGWAFDDSPRPLNEPLPTTSFPQRRPLASGTVALLDHQANLAHMLDGYGIKYRYNLITKQMEWAHPNIPNHGDNAETGLYSHLLSSAALNSLPDKNLDTHLVALGDTNAYNPVTDYLSGLPWDGIPRIERIASQLNASNPQVASIAVRRFLIQACAAADYAKEAKSLNENIEAHFEYVLVLVGAQGQGKTKGLRKLLPRALRAVYRESLVLNTSDKDSLKRALSCWIGELGELDATFGKSAISHKKAFLSQSEDEIRAPYARKSSRYGRRTVFVGTVNEESFLADETGNRRYLPISVGKLDVEWSDEELDQLWAEAWHLYTTGEQWWPTEEEEQTLKENAEKYRIRTEVEERIERHYAWGQRPEEKCARLKATEIYHDVMPLSARPPSEKEVKTIGSSLKRLWEGSGITENRAGQLVVRNSAGYPVSVNAPNGKNRGWLLPPKRSEASSPAVISALRAAQQHD
ncbi:VapE domain-containing protein [Pseudohalocynthiibacter aestuariivivens]|uniref:VapE domain-containing protein n=1 Tax=Pseudohalocynthiibacter aestuariivivens TaxID=1591409 RepID=A0ABV5JJP3_9RHOB|nr:virulence-associated E family protein [Pseudohalocynthiibacter aestuariivivens]MBS9717557.1 hypothetical protein [Pseudohalocynthiibacter aestuariivivens]